MKKLLLVAFMSLAGLTGLSGLAGFAGAAHAETIESKFEMLGTPRYLKVSGLSAKVTNKLLILNVDINNEDDRDNTAYYRVRWLDETGDSVWDEEPWKPILLHGNQNAHLRLVAPTPKARDFKIEFSAKDNARN